jgi:hypothetical protein
MELGFLLTHDPSAAPADLGLSYQRRIALNNGSYNRRQTSSFCPCNLQILSNEQRKNLVLDLSPITLNGAAAMGTNETLGLVTKQVL